MSIVVLEPKPPKRRRLDSKTPSIQVQPRPPRRRRVPRTGRERLPVHIPVHVAESRDLPISNIPLAQTRRWRMALTRAFESRMFTLNACEVGSLFRPGTKVLSLEEKGSTSVSIVILGQLRLPPSITEILGRDKNGNRAIAVKVSFASLVGDNSLELERFVYQKVTTPLIMKDVTPHTMLYVGTFECRDFLAKLMDQQKTNTAHNMVASDLMLQMMAMTRGRYASQFDWNKMTMLVLERGRGQSLLTWMQRRRSWANWKIVLFQIMYTLACFWEVGLMHNDLHGGNIWIDPIIPQPFTYLVHSPPILSHRHIGPKPLMYQMEAQWMCKLYDFDLAYKWDTPNNTHQMNNTRITKYGLCKTHRVCNASNPVFDFHHILQSIRHQLASKPQSQPPELKEFINRYTVKAPHVPPKRILELYVDFHSFQKPRASTEVLTTQSNVYHLPAVKM